MLHTQAGEAVGKFGIGRREILLYGVAAVIILLFARPYLGIVHDGILYYAQAMLRIEPGAFEKDIFFAYGSQDQYTIAAGIYSEIIKRFGAGEASHSLSLLSRIPLAFGMLYVAIACNRRGTVLAAIAVAAFIPYYGGYRIFSYAEPFVTGRLFAEILLLFSIGLILRKKPLPAAGLCFPAMLLHPLATIPVMVWVMFAGLPARVVSGLILAGGGVIFCLAFLAIQPFSNILVSFDPDWLKVVLLANKQVFVSHWKADDLANLASDFLIVCLFAKLQPASERKPLTSLLYSSVLLFVVSLVGADAIKNVLMTGLQLWRVQWILHLLAMLMMPALFLRLWGGGDQSRVAALCLLAGVCGWAFPASALLFAMAWLLVCKPGAIGSGATRVLLFVLPVGVLWFVARDTWVLYSWLQSEPDRGLLVSFRYLSPLLLVVALCVLSERLAFQYRLASGLVLAALLSLLVAGWDSRDAFQRKLENPDVSSLRLRNSITSGSQVYWHGQIFGVWGLLKKPSYYSILQSAGLLFNKGTAAEFARRANVFDLIEGQIQLCRLLNDLNNDEDCVIEKETLASMCEQYPDLDYFVLEYQRLDGFVAEWRMRRTDGTYRNFYLYRCASLRPG